MKSSFVVLISVLILSSFGCELRKTAFSNNDLVVTLSDFQRCGIYIPNSDYNKEKIDRHINYDNTYSLIYDYIDNEGETPLSIHQTVIIEKGSITASLLINAAWELSLATIKQKGCKVVENNHTVNFGNNTIAYKLILEDGTQIGMAIKTEYELVKYYMLLIGITIEDRPIIETLLKDKMNRYDILNNKKTSIFD
jgi:hypothetical protein